MQVFIQNKANFLSARALLGLAEAGYIPGAMFTLSTWYTKAEITRRIAIFFFGMFGGTAISPLLGAGLLKMDGEGGLRGWQWIFLGKSPGFYICYFQILTSTSSGRGMVGGHLASVIDPSPTENIIQSSS
jgi:MFS family permease